VRRESAGVTADVLAAFAATSRSILITDATQADNPISYANVAFTKLSGYSEADTLGRNCRFLQGVDTDPAVVLEIREAIKSGVGIRREILNYRKDGTPFWNDVTIDPVHNAAGALISFVSVQTEADAVRSANAAVADAVSKLESISSHVGGYIYRRIIRLDGTIDIVYCSPSLGILLGVPNTDLATAFYGFVHADDREALLSAIRSSAENMTLFREEFRLVSPSGAVHWMRSDAPPRRLATGEVVWDGLAIEISAEKRWQGEIADLALRDPLTGLLNRRAWGRAVSSQLNKGEFSQCAILYVDIASFRELNKSLGQSICDEVLRVTAQRVSTIAASVSGVGARLAGDEFAILIPACSGEEALSKVARQAGKAFALKIEIADQEVSIKTSIGAAYCAAISPDAADEGRAGELMTQADLSLRWAKQAGAGSFNLYSVEQDDRFQNRAILARSLEHAIADGELELHYQPLVDLASGAIVSAEALVRWRHPTLGLQRPDLFIPLAEETGLIVPLGRWVFGQALRQRKTWEDAGIAPPQISINVSGIQLVDPTFVDYVRDALAIGGSEAKNFEIELTEGQLIEASPLVMAALHSLRNMGFKITIDDFGSGHATFRYLRDFPVDKLKLDQLFVRKLVMGSNDVLIIRAIISLARSMGIAFVAEGIETEMQRGFLEQEGCEIGQGYLFSMPLVAEDFAWIVANKLTLPLASPELAASAIETGQTPGEGAKS
jgi:diguanylate cyclase (GGDEF)-like protein/PAS domain S-box-containing protein